MILFIILKTCYIIQNGVVKYDAFNEMGELSFVLALLTKTIMISPKFSDSTKEGCYTYLKRN